MKQVKREQESGYALLSLLVAMTIGLAVMVSMLSKPSAQFSSQRENEEEMFYRAQNVGEAISKFYTFKGGLAPQNLPLKLEDLLNEFNVNGHPQHIIRKSSLIDPMTGKEWKPVRLGDALIGEFYRTVRKSIDEKMAQALTGGGAAAQEVQRLQQQLQFLTWAAQNSGVRITNLNQSEEEGKDDNKSSSASGFSFDSDNRPIVGVISTFKKSLIRNYYGTASYDKAILMPGVQMPIMNMGAGMPVVGGGAGGTSAPPTDPVPDTAPKLQGGQCPPGSTDPRCPRNFGLGGTTPP